MNIKCISLLLERFGQSSNYNVYLDVYNSDIYGNLYGDPIVTITKNSNYIKNLDWYNFYLENNISTDSEYISIVLRQDYIDNYNFISWIHSNYEDSINTQGYTLDNFDSQNLSIQTYAYGYGYGFGLGGDFFDLVNVYGFSYGYGVDYFETTFNNSYGYGYGYEFIQFDISNQFTRCTKVYDEFNNIVLDSGCVISLPNKESEQILISGRQDFIDSFKVNVDVFENSLTIKGIGNRLSFIDIREQEKKPLSANVNLPNFIQSFDIIEIDSDADEYNCFCVSGSKYDGLYQSINSGASWTKIDSYLQDDVTFCKFSNSINNILTVYSDSGTHKLSYSLDKGVNWSSKDLLGGAIVVDIKSISDTEFFISTLNNGVFYYDLNFPNDIIQTFYLDSIPEGRKLHIDIQDTYVTYGYGYGYGYGTGGGLSTYFDIDYDYSDLFNFDYEIYGYSKGYFLDTSLDSNSYYSYGYGFELLFPNRLLWATNSGLYAYYFNINSSSTQGEWVRLGENDNIVDCYSVYSKENIIYTGSSGKIAASYDSGNSFIGHVASENNYFKGLLNNTVEQIIVNELYDYVYVAQKGQISVSNGIVFKQLVEDFSQDNSIINIYFNPKNKNIIYLLLESVVEQATYISYIVDNSSSVDEYDPNSIIRKYIVSEINKKILEIEPYCFSQIVQFGIDSNRYFDGPEQSPLSSYKNQITEESSGKELFEIYPDKILTTKGIDNLTGGFIYTSLQSTLNDALDNFGKIYNDASNLYEDKQGLIYTNLLDALYLTTKSVIEGGLYWAKDPSPVLGKDYYYQVINARDSEIYNANHIFVLISDGNDFFSLRNINKLLENDNLFKKLKITLYVVIIGNNFDKELVSSLDKLFSNVKTIYLNEDFYYETSSSNYGYFYSYGYGFGLGSDYFDVAKEYSELFNFSDDFDGLGYGYFADSSLDSVASYGYGLGYEFGYRFIKNKIDDFTNFLKTEEIEDVNKAIFRKQIKLNDQICELSNIQVKTYIPANTSIEYRYKFASSNTDLINNEFSQYYNLSSGINNIDMYNIYCSWVEIEFRLIKQKNSEYPHIEYFNLNINNSIKSKIVLKEKSYSYTNKIIQFALSRNLYFNNKYLKSSGISYGYGYMPYTDSFGYGYYNFDLSLVQDYWYFSHSNYWNEETSDKINPERFNISKYRVKEKCTTNEGIVYDVINGPWDKFSTTSVYLNNILVNPIYYSTNPNKGQLRFYQSNKIGDKVTLTIEKQDKNRLFFIINNIIDNSNIKLENVITQFLDYQENISSRTDSIPEEETIDSITIQNYIIDNPSNQTIEASFLIDNFSTLTKPDKMKIDDYLFMTFGEKFNYYDETTLEINSSEYFPHQNKFIFNGFLSSSGNYISINSFGFDSSYFEKNFNNNDNKFAMFQIVSDVSINNEFDIIIGDSSYRTYAFNFYLNYNCETNHLKKTTLGSIHTYLCLGYLEHDSFIDSDEDVVYNNMKNQINYSSQQLKMISNSSGNYKFRIVAPHIINETTGNYSVGFTVQILDDYGNILENHNSGIYAVEVSTYTFDENNDYSDIITNQYNIYIDQSNYGIYEDYVQIQKGITYIKVGDYYSNPIVFISNVNSLLNNKKPYWGDLNCRSILSTGRQSPDFIYDYAKNVSKLDFCAVADDINYYCEDFDISKPINIARFNQIKVYSTKYNVDGEFVVFPAFRFGPSLNSSEIISDSSYFGTRTFIFNNQNNPDLDPDILTGLTSSPQIYPENTITILQLTSYHKYFQNVGKKYNLNLRVDNNIKSSDKLFEIYSEHGNIYNSRFNQISGVYKPNSLISDLSDDKYYSSYLLKIGKKIGYVANSNSDIGKPGLYDKELLRTNYPTYDFNNRGLTCIWAADKKRDTLFLALDSSSTIASTGIRNILYFKIDSINGIPIDILMGEEKSHSRSEIYQKIISFKVLSVNSNDAIIYLYRYYNTSGQNNSIIDGERVNSNSTSDIQSLIKGQNSIISFEDSPDIPANTTKITYQIRIEIKDVEPSNTSHFMWSSPIIINLT